MQNHQKMKVLRSIHVYGTAPAQRQARRRSNLDALPFGRLWYIQVWHAIGYAEFRRRPLCDFKKNLVNQVALG